MLIFGDNLQVMKSLLELKKAGKLCNADGTPGVRLVYIDPPFATKQEFRGTQDQKAYQDKMLVLDSSNSSGSVSFLSVSYYQRLVVSFSTLTNGRGITSRPFLMKCSANKISGTRLFCQGGPRRMSSSNSRRFPA